jgi:hypothetical protein
MTSGVEKCQVASLDLWTLTRKAVLAYSPVCGLIWAKKLPLDISSGFEYNGLDLELVNRIYQVTNYREL